MDRLLFGLPFLAAFSSALAGCPWIFMTSISVASGPRCCRLATACASGVTRVDICGRSSRVGVDRRSDVRPWRHRLDRVADDSASTRGWLGAMSASPRSKGYGEDSNKLATDMQAIMAKAREESAELTDDEEKRYDKMDTTREILLKKERRLQRDQD